MMEELTSLSYEHPTFSKKKVQKAGKSLKKGENSAEVLTIFNNWRSSHALPLDMISSVLSETAITIDSEALIAKRLKRSPSIINKLKLQPTMSLASMQDIGGCRTIVNSIDNVYDVSNTLITNMSIHTLVNSTNYIENPKPSGYRGIHQIYRFNGENSSEEHSGLLVEVQIRTKLQHYWATAVETIGTYLKQSLKSSQGDSKYLAFFSKVGDIFAVHEKQPLLHDISLYRLIRDVRLEAQLLNIFYKLIAFSHATKLIENKSNIEHDADFNADYYLVVTDSEQQSVRVKPILKEHLKEANAEYTKLEQRFRNSATKDTVLVSSRNLKELRETYPNYFNDINKFMTIYYEIIDDLYKKEKANEKEDNLNSKTSRARTRHRTERRIKRNLKIVKSRNSALLRLLRSLGKNHRKITNPKLKSIIKSKIDHLKPITVESCKSIARMKTIYAESIKKRCRGNRFN